MVTDISRLTESPGPMLKHPSTGANYHEGEAIITHLNYALGPAGWDWEWLDQGIDADADEVWVLGKLTARIIEHADEDEGYTTLTVEKTVKGWQQIARRKVDGKVVDLGNNYKAADTDALKRAARLLGVGLDAWAKGGVIQQRQRAEAPKPLKTKLELVADLQRGIAAARGLGLEVDDINAARMDRSQLIEHIADLADKVRTASAAQTQQREVTARSARPVTALDGSGSRSRSASAATSTGRSRQLGRG
jgi:hypothetical protein